MPIWSMIYKLEMHPDIGMTSTMIDRFSADMLLKLLLFFLNKMAYTEQKLEIKCSLMYLEKDGLNADV